MGAKMSEQQQNNIQGEPLDLDTLLDFATVDPEDVETAAQWWDELASPEWIGILDKDTIEDNG
jgi:hypothetical protein